MNNASTDLDYQDSMLIAAKGFLVRHQSEHLNSDTQLLSRITEHLIAALNVEPAMARRLAELAFSEFNTFKNGQCLDLSVSSPAVAQIYQPSTGLSWAVPVELIYQRIIAAPEGDGLPVYSNLF
ncbi:hypothetical protein [Pseudomonas ogarae]|uniref:hypothetical protein n=1 Tax=Pseudomonas ogarae (strain DSM 112162 / CECT 30235 / F113) TaxID=1114970 RepID=UPI0019506E44|nr:hypothetical protein [Pseudomonas ogarae]